MATLATYTTLVQAEVDSASTSSTTVIEQYLKEIYQDIMQDVAEFLVGSTNQEFTATVGDGTVTPNAFIEVSDVQYKFVGGTTFQRVYPITKDEYLKQHINDPNATPAWYYVEAGNVEVVPAPSEAGTVRVEYRAVTPELESDVTSLIPDRYADVVKAGANYKFQAYDKDPSTLEAKALYEEAKRKMIRELSTKQENVDVPLYRMNKAVRTSAESIAGNSR